jgi:hypothetical protein
MSGETCNLVVKVNMKKNVEEGPVMDCVELLEAWVSSGKADSVSDKANGLSGLLQGYPCWFRVIRAILMHYRPK